MKKVALIAAGSLVGLFILGSLLPDPPKTVSSIEKATGVAPVKSDVQSDDVYQKPILMNVADLERRFNKFTDEEGFRHKLSGIKPRYGDMYGSYESHLTDLLVFGAMLNKSDSSVNNIYVIASGDKSQQSSEDALVGLLGVIAVADTSLSQKERVRVLESLGALNPQKITSLDNQVTKNGNMYRVNSCPEWIRLQAFPK